MQIATLFRKAHIRSRKRDIRVMSDITFNPQASAPLHVVLGAGQVGPVLANLLLARGHRVRLVRRGAPTFTRPGLEWMHGDLRDAAFAREACQGAAVVYNTTNPEAYHRWDELLVPLARSVRTAAGQAGAKLVALDCLYMVGVPSKSPFAEDVPMRPCSRKGELRAMLAAELAQAQKRGDVRAATGRAADFFGPGAGAFAFLGDRLGEQLRNGKAIDVFGDPDLPRSYAYVPDVARGLVALGENDAAMGKVWHLPHAWSRSTRELIDGIAGAFGVKAKVRRVPDALLTMAGVFSPVLRAVREMTYQWKVPYVVDDARFRATFGFGPTPEAVALAESARAFTRVDSAAA
jgi:nucleoside-diphosphate-sugar epimerase